MPAQNTLGDMLVRIIGDNVQFDSSIDKSQKKFDNFAKNMLKTGRTLTKFVTLPLLGMGAAAVKFAIDAEETAAKFGTAFKNIRKEADQTAEDLAKGYGLSNTAAQRLLAGTGDLLKGFGATESQALGLSKSVQELAVDLASYNNLQGGGARASQILTRAMLGEREALTSLGIKISEADVKTALLAKGMDGLTGQAGLLAKAQVTLELATAQSGDAMGDFERTSDSAANQLKITKANLENTAAGFGKLMIPAVQRALTAVNNLLWALNDLTDGERRFLLIVAGSAAIIGPALIVVAKMVTSFQALRKAILDTALAFKALDLTVKTTIIGAAVAAVAALVSVTVLLIRRTQEQRREQDRLTEALENTTQAFAAQGKQREIDALSQRLLFKQRELQSLAVSSSEDAAITRTRRSGIQAEIDLLIEKLDALEETEEVTVSLSEKEEAATKALASAFALMDQQRALAAESGEEFDVQLERRGVLLDHLNGLIEDGFTVEGGFIQGIIEAYPTLLGLLEDREEAERLLNEELEARAEALAKIKAAQESADAAWLSGVHATVRAGRERNRLREQEHKEELARIEAERQAQFKLARDTISITGTMVGSLQGLVGAYFDFRDAQRSEDEEKTKAALIAEAIATRTLAVFNIALKTATAVVGFLDNPGGYAGIGLSIAAAVIGAAEGAFVATKQIPNLAQGGVAMPTRGGTRVNVAEAGVPEVIFPLDHLGDILSQIPGGGGDAAKALDGDIHLSVNIDSQPILKKIFPATRNRTVLIDSGAVT